MITYLPHLMRIADAHEETHDVRTLRLEFLESETGERLRWRPGQFGQYSVFGTGECVFTIANPPTRPGHIECTFRGVGKVTSALRRLSPGQLVGFRGPYGNSFPLDDWRGKDIAFVGGGIGMAALHAPLRDQIHEWTPDRFGSSHIAGINAVFADGSVRVISYNIQSQNSNGNLGTWQRICIRNDGLPIDWDF